MFRGIALWPTEGALTIGATGRQVMSVRGQNRTSSVFDNQIRLSSSDARFRKAQTTLREVYGRVMVA